MLLSACCCVVAAAIMGQVTVDLSGYDPACGVRFAREGATLTATWPGGDGQSLSATFDLTPDNPLFASLSVGRTVVGRNIAPRFTITTGSRTERANERYIFFDKPVDRPTHSQAVRFEPGSVRVESTGRRASLSFSKISARPFVGELVVTFYAGSPLLHVEAVMGQVEPRVAYIYDAVLEGDFRTIAWQDVSDRMVRDRPAGPSQPVAVRHRTIMAESDEGTLAVFPPPHAFFFPRDYSDNFKFAQCGERSFGLRQDPAGGPGHRGEFTPWIDAPPERVQRMGMFVLLSAQPAEQTLARVKRYTHDDRFVPLTGRFTFSSHWHMKLTVNEMQGNPRAAETAQIFKEMGVNIVHLAEFHGDGHPRDTGQVRLTELQAMFDLCRKYSDDKLLLIPGEEANALLTTPAPAGQHPGHWLYLFPRPVYLTLAPSEGAPLVERMAPFGTVYHPGTEEQMVEVLRREHALARTANPRIKASFAVPDAYNDREWYKSDVWLGAAWKAMPADLSRNRLGVRALDLLDDMNDWGQTKYLVGEADLFDIDRTHELYGHMNINYLKLPAMPRADDWSSVLTALRAGDFFVTTGEVLIHACGVHGGKLVADLEWTFPLAQAELVTSDGKTAKRRTLPLADTTEFGRRVFEWPLELGPVQWARLEAWDIAGNGAFTQPLR